MPFFLSATSSSSGDATWTEGALASSVLTTQGDVLYRDASGLQRLAAGTSGQFLQTLGAGANPAWADASGGAQLLDSDLTGVTVTNTTAETTALSLTIPAASIPTGTLIRINASGQVTGKTGMPYCYFRCKLEGTTMVTQSFGTVDSPPTYYPFDLAFLNNGGTLQLVGSGLGAVNAVSVALSGDLNFLMTIQWTAASTSNIAASLSAAAYAIAAV